MNILIVDSGSTKTDWTLASNGQVLVQFRTEGFNAAVHPISRLRKILSLPDIQQIACKAVKRVHFYGAGCLPGGASDSVLDELSSVWPNAQIRVASDLVGTARALCGHEAGIVCILGTGSNSCLFDGERIVANTPSLGYILGDEGSGSVLGHKLLTAIFKGLMPTHIRKAFDAKYSLTTAELIKNVYRSDTPNKYMAQFVPFLAENSADPSVRELVIGSFLEFIDHNLMQYPDVKTLPINFTGSVALYFRNLLSEALTLRGLTVGTILASPTDALIAYHS